MNHLNYFTFDLILSVSFEEQLEQMVRHLGNCFECLHCGKTAKTRQHIKNHAETHLEFRHRCEYCGKNFKTTNSLSVHISQNHKISQ